MDAPLIRTPPRTPSPPPRPKGKLRRKTTRREWIRRHVVESTICGFESRKTTTEIEEQLGIPHITAGH